MAERTVAIGLEGQGDRHSEGLAIVQVLEDRERLRRAFRSAGIAFAIAVGFLPVPPLHWVVTPGFLIASVVLFARRMGQGQLIKGGGGPCPQCNQRVDLEEQSLHWPIDMNCPHCRRSLTVKPVTPVTPQ